MTFSSMGGYQDFILNAYLWLCWVFVPPAKPRPFRAIISGYSGRAYGATLGSFSLAYRGDISIPGSKAWNRACHP